MSRVNELISLGGNSMIAILLLSVLVVSVIVYKLIQFTSKGYWRHIPSEPEAVAQALSGLKILEIASVIAPLLGLLGTVIGMISAFQALEAAGGSPEIGTLASGIWKALFTTAAGMVVAIIATTALGVFDGVIERMSLEKEFSK